MRSALALVALLSGCDLSIDFDDDDPADLSGEDAIAWNRLAYERVKADGLPPTHASRLYAYTALASYGAIAGGTADPSVLSQLDGLVLPEPPEDVDWPSAVAAATGAVGASLAKSEESKAAFLWLRDEQIAAREVERADSADVAAGVAHGEAVAAAILDWAAGDRFADTRDLPFEFDDMPGLWVPTAPAYAPCHEPYWGTLRPFVVAPEECRAPDPVEYSEEPGSPFWGEAEAVLQTSQALTEEQVYIAKYWADGAGTGTPPGHWVSIAATVLEEDGADLETATRVQAVLGLTLADSFIGCWSEKYRSCRMRPITYIGAHMDPTWSSLIPTPPFPEYTSGHSVSSAAAAEVLTELLGDRPFVDTTHEEAHGPRAFDSFREAADEAAVSRLYGGIHYPMGIDAGLEQGLCVGGTVLEKTR
jgi:hypothetical protein